MSLNQQIYFPNPLKTRTYGINDVIRADGYGYATLYTVLVSETLKIKDGSFSIDFLTDALEASYIKVILSINSLNFVLYNTWNDVATKGWTHFTLASQGLDNITLKTGDTITIQYVYSASTHLPTGNIKAAIILEDYTA